MVFVSTASCAACKVCNWMVDLWVGKHGRSGDGWSMRVARVMDGQGAKGGR